MSTELKVGDRVIAVKDSYYTRHETKEPVFRKGWVGTLNYILEEGVEEIPGKRETFGVRWDNDKSTMHSLWWACPDEIVKLEEAATVEEEATVEAMPEPSPARKYRYVCSHCGSEDVSCSGTLTWNYDKQDWEFDGSYFDADFCEDCVGETRMEQKFDDEEEP